MVFTCDGDAHHLHSFPTRRSSDLILQLIDCLQPNFASQKAASRFKQSRNGRHKCHPYPFVRIIRDGNMAPSPFRSPVRSTPPPSSLLDRKSTRLNSSHGYNSYAVFCLKKKQKDQTDCQRDGTFPKYDKKSITGRIQRIQTTVEAAVSDTVPLS